MSRRAIASSGARIALGVVAVTTLVVLLQIVSCNRADRSGEGTRLMPCWAYEEEAVVIGTIPFRLPDGRIIEVPQHRIEHHWHPLAVAGWILPPAIALVAGAVAIRRRNSGVLKLGAAAALVVVAAAYFISPLVAWHIGPPQRLPQTPGDEAAAPAIRSLTLPRRQGSTAADACSGLPNTVEA